MPILVDHYATTGVMGGGDNRDQVGGDIDAKLETVIVDRWEVLNNKVGGRRLYY